MQEILTQKEIDMILNSLNDNGSNIVSNENKIKTYDFKRPNKFSREHLRTLRNIFEIFAQNFTNYLTARLRFLASVELLSVQEFSYEEFCNSIIYPSSIAIASIDISNGDILLEMQPVLSFSIIDRLLGGKGQPLEKIREFTEIELPILEKVFIKMFFLMKEAFKKLVDLNIKMKKIESNLSYVRVLSSSENVAILTFKTYIGNVNGLLNLCLPYVTIKPVLQAIDEKMNAEIQKEKDPELFKKIEKKIQNVSVPVKALLGKANITIEKFLSLKEGDIIVLDANTDGNIDVFVADLLKFKGTPGFKKNRIAVKINEVIRETD